MKLKTTMLTRYDGKHVLCVGCDEALGPDQVAADPEATHDLFAAHALMQAMEEFVDESDANYSGDPMVRIMKQAEAILASWGFVEDAG